MGHFFCCFYNPGMANLARSIHDDDHFDFDISGITSAASGIAGAVGDVSGKLAEVENAFGGEGNG